ncbi:MAG: hypothetical protein J6S97_07695 [Bacteroidales bacterium]|nr:hypothetical protein [Bacteroidales bacterium]
MIFKRLIQMRKLSYLLILLLLCLSCVHDRQKEESLTKTFQATGESNPGTRTALTDGQVLWSEGDCISVFNTACPAGEQYAITPGDGGKNQASFTGTDIGVGPWYSLYPHSGDASFNDGALSFSLPGVQLYSDGGFGQGANPMVAVSASNNLYFKNICGLLLVPLKGSGTVKSITITSSSQEALWGSAKVNMGYSDIPELEMTQVPDEEHKSLTLDCGEGLTLGEEALNFYFVIPPGALTGGFTITVSDNTGHQFSKQTSSSIGILRSTLKHMAPLSCPLAGSRLLSCTEWGVYDISGAEAEGIRVFGKDDQAALRSGLEMQFRIQSLVNANALCIGFPASMVEGESYNLVLQSVGDTGVDDATVSAVLLKREDGKCWLEDASGKVGYIIADEL